MIFVGVGTHPQQFNRLLKELDYLIGTGKIKDRVFAQVGYSDFRPKNMECRDFIPLDEFRKLIGKADLVITHGGEGNIGTALQYGKKLVVVPRLKKFGEHTNDHQLELTRAVEAEGLCVAVYSIQHLEEAIGKALEMKPRVRGQGAKGIISLIENFIRGNPGLSGR